MIPEQITTSRRVIHNTIFNVAANLANAVINFLLIRFFLGELGEEKTTPYLIKLINDSDIDVQLATIQALGKIGGSEAKKCLEQCQNNFSETILQATEQALQEIETWEAPFSFSA